MCRAARFTLFHRRNKLEIRCSGPPPRTPNLILSPLTCACTGTNSTEQNITCGETQAFNCDGDAMVVRDSNVVNIDAGRFDE